MKLYANTATEARDAIVLEIKRRVDAINTKSTRGLTNTQCSRLAGHLAALSSLEDDLRKMEIISKENLADELSAPKHP